MQWARNIHRMFKLNSQKHELIVPFWVEEANKLATIISHIVVFNGEPLTL